MAETAPTKVKIPPKPHQEKKKKKKNAPDKPQPTWLFPPDEENPILNPKPKTDEERVKEIQDREKALSYMKRRVHGVPDRPAPPSQLLTLVGIFLTDFGFNSTSRLFTNERKARQELNGWEDAIGKKIEKGTPTLESIYRDWYREWKIMQKDETSSSEDSSESERGAELSVKQETNSSSDDDSETSSDGLGGADVKSKEEPKGKRGKGKGKKKRIAASSSSSIMSESDADDEDEKVKQVSTWSKKATITAKPVGSKPTVGTMINSLKRKATSTSSGSPESALTSDKEKMSQNKKAKMTYDSGIAPTTKKVDTKSKVKEYSSSSSNSSSTSDGETPQFPEKSNAKVSKSNASEKTVKPPPQSENDESPSSSASDSGSDSESEYPLPVSSMKSDVPPKATAQPPPPVQAPSSDSSATVNGDSKKHSVSISSALERSSATSSEPSSSETSSPVDPSPKKSTVPRTKVKHEGAKQTPLATLSANATENSYISNKYQNYDYAERAYQDLSVTRGKGFTKEKNKKKRGSYRGGAIDTAGGKSFKFED